jgi:type IV secretion system protein VirB6
MVACFLSGSEIIELMQKKIERLGRFSKFIARQSWLMWIVIFRTYFLVKKSLNFNCFKYLRSFLAILLIFLHINMFSAKAEDTMDTIITILSGLNCETKGTGDLLRSEFSHTCIPAPFFTFLVANLVSPLLYANTMLRVKINDDSLFFDNQNNPIKKPCSRANRIDFNDQKLSFAMCNNLKLEGARLSAIEKSAVFIVKAYMFSEEAPWDKIKEAWNIPKSDYHDMFPNKREGESGMMIDIGIIPVFPWKVIKEKDTMCVATQSFSGWIPIGCKYIKEPYPISIYSEFMDINPEQVVQDYNNVLSLTKCSNAGGCYKRAIDHSKTGIVMSGPLIECVKEMIAKLMVSNAVCSFSDIKSVLNSSTRTSSALFQFQVNMHKTVAALLTLYVILFGFKMVLAGDIPEKTELVNFVIKFLFVVYFSVGINISQNSGNDLNRLDGMIEWAFPFLLDGMTQLASWIISASPSELCKFYSTDYAIGMSHIALWDSLDCRVSHYLGLDMIQTMIVENASRNHDFSQLDILSFPIPPYIYLLVPAVISGNFTLISLALMYPLMIISVAAFVVNATVVCMISIVVLGVLAPLFVPMYLFEYTKGYFEAWVKLLISFMLQPMVAIVFMTTMLSVYDFGFYGTCKYKYKEMAFSGAQMQMVTLNGTLGTYEPGDNGGGRAIRYYYLDNDWVGSGYTKKEKKDCINSLGYILNNPLGWLFSTGSDILTNDSMPWIDDASGAKDKERYPDVLGPVESKPGMFFGTIEVIFEKIKAFALALLVACFTLYLMQHFSETLAEFAADMTEGVSIGNMAIKPQTLYKAGMAAMSAAGGAKGGGDKAAAGGAKGGGDKAAAGAGGGGDNFSTASFKGRKGGGGDNFSTASSKGDKDVSSTKGGNKEGGDA